MEEAIVQKNLKTILDSVNKLLWNSNMRKTHYLNVLYVLESFNENNIEIEGLKSKINEIFDKKGWNAL